MFGQRAAGGDLALADLAAVDRPLARWRRRRCRRPRRRRSRLRQPALRSAGASSATGGLDRARSASPSRRLLLGLLVRLLVLVRLQQVGRVEEGALLLTDVDERRLDAGENRFDSAEVDVADRAPMVGAVDQQLDQTVVFEDGHAGFPLAPVDQDLALQIRTSAAAERRPGASANRPPQHIGNRDPISAATRRPGGVPDEEHTRAREAARQRSAPIICSAGA